MNNKPVICALFALAFGALPLFMACERHKSPAPNASGAHPTGKREYGEIKPVMLSLPDNVVKILSGTDVNGDPVREVAIYFRSMTLVVYRLNFDVAGYIDRISQSFAALTLAPEFTNEADVWAIQVQQRSTGRFVTISCSLKQARDFVKSRAIRRFLQECDYLMINDVIVSDPEDRHKYYTGRLAPPPLQPASHAP